MGRFLPPLLASLLLSACATAGPDYHAPTDSAASRPAATAPFVSAGGDAFTQAPLPDRWWRLYADDRLDALVGEALGANTDLRVADANLRRADAVVREAQAGRALTTTVEGGASLARPSGKGGDLPGVVGYDLGFAASYPLDLRGKIARGIEAARADSEAVTAARDAVRISVAAATAKAYADVCGANYALAVNQRIVALQRDTLDATRRLATGGRGTAFDVSRAQAAVDQSAATIPVFVARRQTALFLLATLLGRPPAEYPRDVATCAVLPALSAPLPVGDGAALIRRRPDIRAAERAIAGDTARIGVATADLYPQVSIGGSLGLTGALRDAGSTSAFGFSLGPLLSWSFPNRPVVRARIEQADARVAADLANFDGVVLGALRQTETSLEVYARDRDSAGALAKARDSTSLSARQAQQLFRFGRGDFLSLLDAQRTLASAEAANAAAQAQLVDDQIAIFLALGGGWQ
ncbi:TolC family protein [Sphingomonas naphthae]|uniref:TolC family protein n=1 Tax=Sphingomonas naphthae TaxID=1813468 RepID=A0ABY7TMD5_9SPHN|nr:TolC family protein [Sphingomonas naphthae]WCT72999.1 TolC family protein [Sphingomonas naphthae]